MLDRCERGNKIAPLWQKWGMSAKEMQFYCPSSTNPAINCNSIISTLFYCSTIEQILIQVPSEVRHTWAEGVLYNKELIIQLLDKCLRENKIAQFFSKAKINILRQFFFTSSHSSSVLGCSVRKNYKNTCLRQTVRLSEKCTFFMVFRVLWPPYFVKCTNAFPIAARCGFYQTCMLSWVTWPHATVYGFRITFGNGAPIFVAFQSG